MTKRADRGSGSITPYIRDGIQRGWQGYADLGLGPDGKRRRRHVYGASKREVRDKLNAVLVKHRDGTLPRSGKLTLGQWLTTWHRSLESSGSRRPRTLEHYRLHVERYLIPTLGAVQLAELTPTMVESALGQLTRSLSPRTVAHARSVLRNALNRAIRDGLINVNAAARAEVAEVAPYEAKILDPDQIRVLLDHVNGDRLEALYVTAVYLGLRMGELLGLRWSEVDLVAGILRVSRALQRRSGVTALVQPKSETSRRTLRLPEPVIEALRQHRDQQAAEPIVRLDSMGLVFTAPDGRPLEPTAVLRLFQGHLRAAGLPVIRFHDLRHSCASILLASGVPLTVVSSILGHSSIRLTSDTYGHLLARSQEEAAKAMTRILGGAVGTTVSRGWRSEDGT
jgi:integrase